MPEPSKAPLPWPEQTDRDLILERFLGLGERLSVKSYYPQLKQRLAEIEEKSRALEATLEELSAAKMALTAMNEALEQKVTERTAALEEMIGQLKKTQDALIMSEKMATFGRISAGIANDLNSPLGAINSATNSARGYIDDLFDHLAILMSKSQRKSIQRIRELIPQAISLGTGEDHQSNRSERRKLAAALEAELGAESDWYAELAVELGLQERLPLILAELGKDETKDLLEVLADIMGIYQSNAILKKGAQIASDSVRSLRSLDEGFSQEHIPQYQNPVDLDESIREALSSIDASAHPGLVLKTPHACGQIVRSQYTALLRTWQALLENAMQAVAYSGTVSMTVAVDGQYIVVQVMDDGCGIPPEIQAKIWDPFFTTRPPGEGAGFGLMVAKRTVERSGGSIDFTSEAGNTVFRVKLLRYDHGVIT